MIKAIVSTRVDGNEPIRAQVGSNYFSLTIGDTAEDLRVTASRFKDPAVNADFFRRLSAAALELAEACEQSKRLVSA